MLRGIEPIPRNFDVNAAENLADRLHDEELWACKNGKEIKALLLRCHEQWKHTMGWP
jgi:hypothetical protein